MKFFQEIKNKTNESRFDRRDAYQRDYDSSVSNMGRPADHRGLSQELAHETNNIAISINGRVWKVIPGRGYADSKEEWSYLNGMKSWAEKKSAQSGKKWTVSLTGAPVSETIEQPAQPVKEDIEDSPVYGAIIHRIMVAHHDLLAKYGPEKIMDAAREEAEWVGDVDEIGSSDVSAWVNNIKRNLGGGVNEAEGDAEGLPHMTRALLKDILDQVKTEGPHAIAKSVEWGDGAAEELTNFIVKKLKELENKEEVTEAENPEDVISVDVPLFIRLMEYAREDAKTDMDLHRLTEKLTAMCAGGKALTMADYDAATGTDETNIRNGKPAQEEMNEDENMPTGNLGYDNMSAILRAVDAGKDAVIHLGGEPVTLEYPEARFIGGKYKAFLRAGRQDEFLKYMSNPVAFDRLMAQLRGMLDKIKNFKGSVPGERGVPESTGPMKIISRNGEDMDESAPPNFPQDLEKKLKAEYKDNPEKAYATMWMIHNRKKNESVQQLPATAVNEYWCQIDKQAKPIPEGYKKLASGYITRK